MCHNNIGCNPWVQMTVITLWTLIYSVYKCMNSPRLTSNHTLAYTRADAVVAVYLRAQTTKIPMFWADITCLARISGWWLSAWTEEDLGFCCCHLQPPHTNVNQTIKKTDLCKWQENETKNINMQHMGLRLRGWASCEKIFIELRLVDVVLPSDKIFLWSHFSFFQGSQGVSVVA